MPIIIELNMIQCQDVVSYTSVPDVSFKSHFGIWALHFLRTLPNVQRRRRRREMGRTRPDSSSSSSSWTPRPRPRPLALVELSSL